MTGILFFITVALFSGAAGYSILALHDDSEKYVRRSRHLFYCAVAGFILVGAAKYYPFSSDVAVRIASSIWGYFYLLAALLIALLVYLRFSPWRQYWRSISPISLLFIAVFLVVSAPFLNSARTMRIDLVHGLLPFHVVITIAGELFFFFSFIASILYLVMQRQLKKKSSMRFINRLPNLEALERFNMWATVRALLLLTAGLALGIVLLWMSFGVLFNATLKEIVIYGSWLVILILYLMRRYRLLNPYATNYINIFFFAVLMSAFLLSNIAIRSGFHSFR